MVRGGQFITSLIRPTCPKMLCNITIDTIPSPKRPGKVGYESKKKFFLLLCFFNSRNMIKNFIKFIVTMNKPFAAYTL